MDYLQFGEGGGGGVGRNDVQPGTIVFSLLQTHILNIICTYQPDC